MTHETHRIGPFDLVHLIRALGRRHFEGVLHLSDTASDRAVRVYFVGGAPAWCRSEDVVYSFAAHALRRKLAPPDTLRGLLRQAEGEGILLENLLLEEGVLDEARLLAEKTTLSTSVFERMMAAAALDYHVEWTRTVLGAGATPQLDPWAAFFRVVSSGANAEFQRSYVMSRRQRRLRPTPQLHALLPQVESVFGEVARALVHQAVDGVTAAAALDATSAEAATAPLFALIYSNLISCRDGAEPEVAFPGLDRPAPGTLEFEEAGRQGPVLPEEADTEVDLPAYRRERAAGIEPGVQPPPREAPRVTAPPAAPPGSAHEAPVSQEARAAEAAGRELASQPLALADQEQFQAGREGRDDGAGWAQSIPVATDDGPPERGDPSIENALSETLLKLQKANAYKALDVPKDASFSQIREAHQRLRRKYDESQYRTFVLGKRGYEMLAEIAKLLDRAVRVLNDPRLRPAHDQKLGLGDGTLSPELQAAFKAEAAYNAGLRHLKSQDWDSAMMAFRSAIEQAPKDASYHAHYAWALFRMFRAGEAPEPDTMQRIWTQLAHALELNPRLSVAHLFRARIAKETGDADAAIESWQKVLAAIPDHQEAQNELRMLREAGHHRKPTKPAKGGVLGGLFRRGTHDRR